MEGLPADFCLISNVEPAFCTRKHRERYYEFLIAKKKVSRASAARCNILRTYRAPCIVAGNYAAVDEDCDTMKPCVPTLIVNKPEKQQETHIIVNQPSERRVNGVEHTGFHYAPD